MRTLFLAATVAALALQPAAAATAPAFPAISVDTLKGVTSTLASDAFEGRAPTTPGEDKSIVYIAGQFAKAGLKPGNNGSWYQDVPLVQVTATPSVMTISGGRETLSFSAPKDMVVGTHRTVPHVDLANSPLVFVGYGINAPERGWNDYAGVDVKGKTVVILVNDPDWRQPLGQGAFGGREMTYYGRWTYKYEEAVRQGAAAALIIHETEPAAYPWDVVVSSWTGPQLDLDDAGTNARNLPMQGWLSNDAAHRLFAAAGQDLDALAKAAGQKGFHAVPLNLQASLTLDNKVKRQLSHNVVGLLPGSSRPGEYFLYSAHWDHFGHCTPDASGDDICNGAIDNASGVAGLVALAKANAKAGPAARSMIFLAVTAEEAGLLGSAYYAAHPLYPLGKTVAGINMDVMNVYGATRDIEVIGRGKSELEPILERWAKVQGRLLVNDATPERGHYFRSDHFSFAKQGVPMLAAGSGQDLVNGGIAAGKARAEDYNTNHYHKPSDEYDPNWDWSGAVQDLQLYYVIGRELADGKSWPNWYPTAEFRAARDKSRAGQKD